MSQSNEEEKRDYRYVGPVFDCPVCKCAAFQTVIVFDTDTQLPGMYMTSGRCVECAALVRLPTPIDEMPIERRAVEEEA